MVRHAALIGLILLPVLALAEEAPPTEGFAKAMGQMAETMRQGATTMAPAEGDKSAPAPLPNPMQMMPFSKGSNCISGKLNPKDRDADPKGPREYGSEEQCAVER